MLKNHYLSLTKPGIIFGNLITATGGFYLIRPHASFWLLCATLLGVALVIASGCVFNNYIDRDIDPLMERTKNRPSACGLVSNKLLLLFGSILGLCGFAILYFFTNSLATMVALIGFVFYVVAYSLYFKRGSVFGTAIGSVSGAIPPVIGYCAANNRFDLGAIILFLILVLWQMPHSYAIAIYRLPDYIAANIPVLPTKKSLRYTKISMLMYVIIFTFVAISPSFLGFTGIYYLVIVGLISLYWIYLTAKGFATQDNTLWARKVFLFSIIVITLMCIMMVVD